MQLSSDLGGTIAVNQWVWRHFKNVSRRKITASAATISLVAFSCKRKRKGAKRLWMCPLFQRQHEYYVTWFHQMPSLAATLSPHEYFPTCLKACNNCMHELQSVATVRCVVHETTALRSWFRRLRIWLLMTTLSEIVLNVCHGDWQHWRMPLYGVSLQFSLCNIRCYINLIVRRTNIWIPDDVRK